MAYDGSTELENQSGGGLAFSQNQYSVCERTMLRARSNDLRWKLSKTHMHSGDVRGSRPIRSRIALTFLPVSKTAN